MKSLFPLQLALPVPNGYIRVVRKANLHFLGWLSDDDWARQGTVGDDLVSVRALAFVMAGHVRHHMTVLRDQYGVVPGP